MRTRSAPRYSRGLTLLELIIVMGIVGILASIAIPSYKYFINSNRVASEVNGLVGDLMYARSEAIKEGSPVSVCVASTGSTPAAPACAAAATTSWQSGWIVFSDPNNDHTLDNGDTVLHVQSAFAGTDTFTASGSIGWISFNREGFATANGGLTATSLLTLHSTPVVNAATRCLQINIVGLLSIQTYGNPVTCT
jgi:type IV fimbrial biogenesis protein FimT